MKMEWPQILVVFYLALETCLALYIGGRKNDKGLSLTKLFVAIFLLFCLYKGGFFT